MCVSPLVQAFQTEGLCKILLDVLTKVAAKISQAFASDRQGKTCESHLWEEVLLSPSSSLAAPQLNCQTRALGSLSL